MSDVIRILNDVYWRHDILVLSVYDRLCVDSVSDDSDLIVLYVKIDASMEWKKIHSKNGYHVILENKKTKEIEVSLGAMSDIQADSVILRIASLSLGFIDEDLGDEYEESFVGKKNIVFPIQDLAFKIVATLVLGVVIVLGLYSFITLVSSGGSRSVPLPTYEVKSDTAVSGGLENEKSLSDVRAAPSSISKPVFDVASPTSAGDLFIENFSESDESKAEEDAVQ